MNISFLALCALLVVTIAGAQTGFMAHTPRPTNIAVSDLADGTDGQLITWDAAGAPAVVATGTVDHVLTSGGAGVAPTFQASSSGFDLFDISNFGLVEDFCSGNLQSPNHVGSSAMSYWQLDSGGTGTNPGETDNPCAIELVDSATDNSGVTVYWSSVGNVNNDLWDTTEWWADAVVSYMSRNTTIAWFFGAYNNDDPDDAAAGIWIRFDTDRSDTTAMFQICDASGAAGCDDSTDDTNSSVEASTVAAATLLNNFRLRIHFDPTGVGSNPTYYFRVNDETEVTFCSSGCDDDLNTLPTGDMKLAFSFLSRDTGDNGSMHLDFMSLKRTGLSRY
jgi:hypothetical protein